MLIADKIKFIGAKKSARVVRGINDLSFTEHATLMSNIIKVYNKKGAITESQILTIFYALRLAPTTEYLNYIANKYRES